MGAILAQEAAKKLTLDDCLNIAYKKNRTLLNAKTEKDLAKVNINKTVAVCLPAVDARSSYHKYGLLPADSRLNEDNYRNEVTLTQPIFNSLPITP